MANREQSRRQATAGQAATGGKSKRNWPDQKLGESKKNWADLVARRLVSAQLFQLGRGDAQGIA